MMVPAQPIFCLISSCARPGTVVSALTGRLLATTSMMLYRRLFGVCPVVLVNREALLIVSIRARTILAIVARICCIS